MLSPLHERKRLNLNNSEAIVPETFFVNKFLFSFQLQNQKNAIQEKSTVFASPSKGVFSFLFSLKLRLDI